jgi:dihydrolipoamide dehydrogenase
MPDKNFDAAVIGGGPGGYVCAIRLARYGKKTALVEARELGGTCLNRGCIPAKTLLHTAEIFDEIKNHGKELGLITGGISVDYAVLGERKEHIITRLRKGVESLVKARGIEIIRGQAALTGAGTFRAGGETYSAENIVLATGSEPAAIPVPGADGPNVMNSDTFLSLKELPESAVIIGGGVIGIEFAALLSSFGKKVVIIEMLPRILGGMDETICDAITKALNKRGVEIHTGAKLLEIAAVPSGIQAIYEKDETRQKAQGAAAVIAVGRRPVTKALSLETAGIVPVKGFVTVDERMRTGVPGIYAVGDITGKLQLAHVAGAQGLVAAANIAGKETKMRYDIVPACVYTNPEIAGVGLTEEAVKAAGLPYRIGHFPAAANGRSLIMNAADGFVKIITHAETGEILGAHIMAARATDLIGEIAAAMRAEATIGELADTVHGHPTVNEMIMEAAHDVEGLCVHKP